MMPKPTQNLSGQKPSNVKIINFDELKPFSFFGQSNLSQQIAAYLRTAISASVFSECLLLPSLSSLSQHFNTTAMEVRDAFRVLRTEGFDSFTPGLYGHISVWPRRLRYSSADTGQPGSASEGGKGVLGSEASADFWE